MKDFSVFGNVQLTWLAAIAAATVAELPDDGRGPGRPAPDRKL
jgi:hypothetical protein